MASEIPLIAAARKLQAVLDELGRPYCIIGGLAVQRWGQPRVTEDVDAMVFTDLEQERETIQSLLSVFQARRNDAEQFAKVRRVLLMFEPESEIGLVVSLGAFEYERHAAERATEAEYEPGVYLRTCSAEDLIVYKAFAARELDWLDIQGILIRQQGKLDFDLIERELLPLVELKEEPEILTRWHALRERYR